MTGRLLVISFQGRLDKKVAGLFWKEGYNVVEIARDELRQQPLPGADVILLNCGKESFEVGREILERLKSRDETVPTIFLTRTSRVDHAVEIMKSGAFDYF